jgi:hypothetical protein
MPVLTDYMVATLAIGESDVFIPAFLLVQR